MRSDLMGYLSRGEIWIGGSALLALLVGTWGLRGAPPGQAAAAEDDVDAPRAGYRDRIVVAVIVGLMLIAGGAYAAFTRGVLWSLPFFVLGFGLVVALISINQRYRHSSPSLRRTIDFASSFLNAALLAGILIVANVMAFRYGGQPLDFTREQTYSLSTMTLNQLESLKEPVTFTMVFGRGPRALRQRERVTQLLESYKAVNPRMVQLVSLDPYSELNRGDDFFKRVPELSILQGGGVVIEHGQGDATEHVVVRNQDLFHALPLSASRGQDQFASSFTGEDEITSALLRLREGKKSKVGFTTGHGESPTGDLNPEGRGIGNWKVRLAKVGCEVIDLNLIQEEIPEKLSLLVIVGPKTPFKPEEVAKLKAFASGGGTMMLLLGNSEPSGLDEFLKSYNLEIGRGLVIDPRYNYNRNPSLVFAPTAAAHPVVDPLGANRAVLLPGAAPLHVLGQPQRGRPRTDPVDPSLLPVPILLTTNYSWAESNIRNPPLKLDLPDDEPGPLTVGVAVSERGERTGQPGVVSLGKPRLVLFSCPSMAENLFEKIEQTNLDLLMNAASWLRNRPDTQGIPPHTHVALTLSVDPFLRSRLILVPSAVAAMAIIALGLVVYVARRQ